MNLSYRLEQKNIVNVIFLSLLQVMTGVINILPVYRQHLQSYLCLADDNFGLLFSVGPLSAIGAVILCGSVINCYGAIRVMRWCLWGISVGMLIIASCGANWLVLLLGIIISNFFIGPLMVAVNVYLTKMFPERLRQVLTINLTIVGFGALIAPLSGEMLLKLALPSAKFSIILHWPFGVMTALILFFSLFFGCRQKNNEGTIKILPVLSDFRVPLLSWTLIIMGGLHAAVDTTLYTWIPKFLETLNRQSGTTVLPGVVLALYSLSVLFARGLLSFLPEHWGRRMLLVFPGLLGGMVLLFGLSSGDSFLIACSYIAGGFIWSVEYPAILGQLAGTSRNFAVVLALLQIVNGVLIFGLMYGVGYFTMKVGSIHMNYVMSVPATGFIVIGLIGAIAAVQLNYFKDKCVVCPPHDNAEV